MVRRFPWPAVLPALLLAGCGIFPAEMNLGPLYRHRLDGEGRLLDLDLLWPLIKYQRFPDGGWEFRLRPLYRTAREGDREDHHFLWPLGRASITPDEERFRLLPLVYWRSHLNDRGGQERDWVFLFPLLWGGTGEGDEDYLALWPLYGRIPTFLSYEEAGWFLFPLYTWSRKGDARTWSAPFPLVSHGWSEAEEGPSYWRFLPFFSRYDAPGRAWSRSVLWPLVSWGEENLAGRDPRHHWFLFPLAGAKHSRSGDFSDWTFLWPFFRCRRNEPGSLAWDGPWPLFRWADEAVPRSEERFRQWWLMPLYAATDSERLWSRVILYPLIRRRRFRDRALERDDTWLLPLYWGSETRLAGHPPRRATTLFPLFSRLTRGEEEACTRIPDPFPWRLDRGSGYRELYDFLWNIYTVSRNREEERVETPANLYRRHRTATRTTWSIPFLFSVERSRKGGGKLRLFQLFPISWGGEGKEEEGEGR